MCRKHEITIANMLQTLVRFDVSGWVNSNVIDIETGAGYHFLLWLLSSMKITKVRVHNFRSIIDADIHVSDYFLIVGPNNCGKSSVIDAIRAFYTEIKFTDADMPKKGSSDKDCWVELTYQLSNEELEQSPSYVVGNQLCVRRWLKTTAKLDDGKNATGALVPVDAVNGPVGTKFEGWPNVGIGRLGSIIYIPAVSKHDDHTKLTGPSDFRDLLKSIMDGVVSESDEYANLCGQVKSFSDGIRNAKNESGFSIEDVQQKIGKELASWGVAPQIELVPPPPTEILKSFVRLDLVDEQHGGTVSPDMFGSGFQRHFIYTLVRVRAEVTAKQEKPGKQHFSGNLALILFEEPEAFLHPPQQDLLSRSLRELSALPGMQVICATHSPHFVSRQSDTITGIVRGVREVGVTAFYQIDAATWINICLVNDGIQSILATHGLLAGQTMTTIRYFLMMNSERSCLFFADKVLLVEGPTEVGLINQLVESGKLDFGSACVHIVDCLGKFNIHRFISLCNGLGIPHSVLHDEDSGGVHTAVNSFINSCKGPHTKQIVGMVPDLEQELGIVFPAGPTRDEINRNKPYLVLNELEHGRIPSANLDSFCRKVEALLTF